MSKIETDNPTAEFIFTFSGEDVVVTLEFHFSDNAEDFFDVGSIVNGMVAAIAKEVSA